MSVPSGLKTVDEGDDLSNGGDLGGFLFRDFAVEFLFDGHDQFNGVKGVKSEVIDELSIRDNFVFVASDLLDNDFLDFIVVFTVQGSVGSESNVGRCESSGASDKGEGDDRLEHDEM